MLESELSSLNEAWEQLKPKDSFSIVLGNYIGDMDYQVLNLLYQPIIGLEAYGLMNTLLVESTMNCNNKQDTKQLHTVLLDRLDIGIPTLYHARIKLEAVGLLKTFVRLTDTNRHFIYEIQKPLEPSVFLQDDILSLLLLEKIGEERLKKIAEKFDFNQDDLSSYTDVTKNFIQVFSFDPMLLSSYQESMMIVKEKVQNNSKVPTIDLQTNSFDWEFFMNSFGGVPINDEQLEKELKKTIETFHYLYGINELDMQDYVKRSLDIVTNKVDIKEFKQLVYKQYHKRKKQHVNETIRQESDSQNVSLSEQKTVRSNTLKLSGFTEGEIAVLTACEKTPPMLFLKAIKHQKNGFVSNNERWTVENLKKQSGLPDSVLNILIHYMLVVQGHASLNQNMMNSIANDWGQAKVFAPEDALKKVKEFQAQKEQQPTKNKSYKNTQVRKETLPDWAKETGPRKETPLSSEEQAFFEEELRKLNNNQKDGDS